MERQYDSNNNQQEGNTRGGNNQRLNYRPNRTFARRGNSGFRGRGYPR